MVNTVESASYKSVEKPPSAVVNTQACETLHYFTRTYTHSFSVVRSSDIHSFNVNRDNVMEEAIMNDR